MKLLALDTATERCSVALWIDGSVAVRDTVIPRGHAELILQMVDEVLSECSVSLRDLDALAYGRGPGAFTGVRIAIGVVQGLAYGADRPVVGISNLAAVAQAHSGSGNVLVCMDARMNEVYWCAYRDADDGLMQPLMEERLSPPDAIDLGQERIDLIAGTALVGYPTLATRYAGVAQDPQSLPHAREIATLAVPEVLAGRVHRAQDAMPVYLRDRVVAVR
ncbi:MAG: tRNA (adenosine(37)-N6)-threonylcarbamoyltransferase complex dimerization subunit type 1 TsaB [Steroidobacteraceae bacterium]